MADMRAARRTSVLIGIVFIVNGWCDYGDSLTESIQIGLVDQLSRIDRSNRSQFELFTCAINNQFVPMTVGAAILHSGDGCGVMVTGMGWPRRSDLGYLLVVDPIRFFSISDLC